MIASANPIESIQTQLTNRDVTGEPKVQESLSTTFFGAPIFSLDSQTEIVLPKIKQPGSVRYMQGNDYQYRNNITSQRLFQDKLEVSVAMNAASIGSIQSMKSSISPTHGGNRNSKNFISTNKIIMRMKSILNYKNRGLHNMISEQNENGIVTVNYNSDE